MAVFKCKMCGASLDIDPELTVVECTYCESKQTLPKLTDEKRNNLYDRANHFRRNNEYDKAMSLYEQILNEDNTDAEAYWSIVLCRFGIDYVEDPQTHKRIPTINRMQNSSIIADADYKAALEHADAYQRSVYQEEAKTIDGIQKGILEVAQKEDPFDIFICYKETDSAGRRTHDSVLAQQLYHELTNEGYKVFFSRITLEDKLGVAYEPYIFAALNSSKVMIALGTKAEYFNAPWVKNEWSRYLALIKKGEKKMLIPAYRDLDPYDLPEEFSHLQAQDMSKLGFMQDLIRGIKKIVVKNEPQQPAPSTVMAGAGGVSLNNILKRTSIFLGDGDFANAREYCEKALDMDPECAEAYAYRLMCRYKMRKIDDLATCREDFSNDPNYVKANQYGNEKIKGRLAECLEKAKENFVRDQAEKYKKECIEKLNDNIAEAREKIQSETAELKRSNTLASSTSNDAQSIKRQLRKAKRAAASCLAFSVLQLLLVIIAAFGIMIKGIGSSTPPVAFLVMLGIALVACPLPASISRNVIEKNRVDVYYDFRFFAFLGWTWLMLISMGIVGIVSGLKTVCLKTDKFVAKQQGQLLGLHSTINSCQNRINTLNQSIERDTAQLKAWDDKQLDISECHGYIVGDGTEKPSGDEWERLWK